MGLSRLDNFLKSSRGTILYVNPNDLDSTDSIENLGNSLTRPFRTIQRALVEAARFSYQRGLNNDRFGNTTILVYPGEHVIDNRPGWIPDGINTYRLRNGVLDDNLPPYDSLSNFDVNTATNELYKLNSIYGGVIVPRGTSIVGLDLRKTKLRPKYVPDPENDSIEKSAIFRITGGCYFWQFSMFDADPNSTCFKDYTQNTAVPNYSHHKLTCFEYADGVNPVRISDEFQTYNTDRTDLDMYYEKVGLVYGQSSGRTIEPDYPSNALDIEKKIDEYRIVGSTGITVGISSIRSGDGVDGSTTITVTTAEDVPQLEVDTPFRIEGISVDGYDGQYVVFGKNSDNEIVYNSNIIPLNPLPSNVAGATLTLSSDTVTSASPYVFNCSLRSVFGMNGLHADGDKATGFKSMVVAQFTGIGLQKDDRAFVLFNQNSPSTGVYEDSSAAGNETLSNDSRSRYKPTWKNTHIKCSNKSVIQAVSCFAIGFAEQFVTVDGGDISLTNSNSNFGAIALTSDGYRDDSFAQDNQGYITHIIPPEELESKEFSIEYNAIDILRTLPQSPENPTGIGSDGNLYLYNQTNRDSAPEHIIQGYRIGAKDNDKLNYIASQSGTLEKYSSRIVMTERDSVSKKYNSSEKSFKVDRTIFDINRIGANSDGGITNVITLTEEHNFFNGESIRVISSNGHLPDGLLPNTIYYVITESTDIPVNTYTNIKIAKTFNDALNDREISLNGKGGELTVVSKVSDKNPGDFGHPIQYDETAKQWYIKIAETVDDTIYSSIVSLGTDTLGDTTPRTFIERRKDDRSSFNRIYHVRYVLPKDSPTRARPPIEGYIIQESESSNGDFDEITKYFGNGTLSNPNEQRNIRVISNAEWNSTNNKATIFTEIPHNLLTGNTIKIEDIQSSENTTANPILGFNGKYTVSEIINSKAFTVNISIDPGEFLNDTSIRTENLPSFTKVDYNNVYYIYKVREQQQYIEGNQDGVYYLTILNSSNKPTVAPFRDDEFSQPIQNLYPQNQRDQPVSDPESSICHARSSLIGQIDINDPRKSVTKENIDKFVLDTSIGIGVTSILSNPIGIAHTIETKYDHGLNSILKVSFFNNQTGANYGTGAGQEEVYYNAKLVSAGGTTGEHATAKVNVSATGVISNIQIMDGGSAYGIGNTLSIIGVTTSAGHIPAIVQVDSINDAVGDVIRIVGVGSDTLQDYNQLYRVTEVPVGAATTVHVESLDPVTNILDNPSGALATLRKSNPYFYTVGREIVISEFAYNHETGLAEVTTSSNHGFYVGEKVRFFGLSDTTFNTDFVIDEVLNELTGPTYKFVVKVGTGSASVTETGSDMRVCSEGYASNVGNLATDTEIVNGRMVDNYDGILSTLGAPVLTYLQDNIRINNAGSYNIQIGDYFVVGNEIMRVKATTFTSSITGDSESLGDNDNIGVFRGLLGTKPEIHEQNATIKRIKVIPIEFRRHSIIRASGHTFEYVGYGPGNYSTAFPDRQDREITDEEELLSQSTRRSAGINFYTGMNDRGVSYTGNKRTSITGTEDIFDTPLQTIEGEDISNGTSINVTQSLEGTFSRSVKVDGGEDRKAVSEFNGPIIVNNKLTVNSEKGLESDNLFLQGDATVSRKYTVGLGTPILSGNPGDLVFNANPVQGGNAGWIYTLTNDWKSFGTISLERDTKEDLFDRVGIATTTAGDKFFQVLGDSNQFSVDAIGHVGIGTSANGFALNVVGGSAYIDDDLKVGAAATISNMLHVNSGGVLVSGASTVNGLGIVSMTSGTFAGMGVSVYAVGTSQTAFFYGDGHGLFNLNADQVGWIRQGTNLSYEDVLNGRVGIGTSIPTGGDVNDYLLGYSLTVGSETKPVGWSTYLSLYVHDDAQISGSLTIDNNLSLINQSGITTITTDYRFENFNGRIVGYAATLGNLGVNTTTSLNELTISGVTTSTSHTYLRSYSEENITDSDANAATGILTLDLSLGQNFEIQLTTFSITKIRLINLPAEESAMSFTVKFTQPVNDYWSVNLDNIVYVDTLGTERTISSIRWPGGVVPQMTQAIGAIDIYSFKSFDITNLNTTGLYGIVGGQNFS